MYAYSIRKDSEGIYYAMQYNGLDFYIHRFSFPSIEDAHVAAFNHVLSRVWWDKLIGYPNYFYNGRV
jgi:hypothetical protein